MDHGSSARRAARIVRESRRSKPVMASYMEDESKDYSCPLAGVLAD